MKEPPGQGPTPQQQAALRRARESGPRELTAMLYRYLREKDAKEPLEVGWADLWDRWGVEAKELENAPPEVYQVIEEALKSVQRIDGEISGWSLHPQIRLAILLGAGASAPEPSCIPTVAGLLPELWRRAKKIGRDDLDSLEAWCQSHKILNIEDLLTAAYIANFSAKNASVTGLLDYFLFRGRRLPAEEEWTPRARVIREMAPRMP